MSVIEQLAAAKRGAEEISTRSGSFWMRPMSCAHKDRIAAMVRNGDANVIPMAIAGCLCDAKGNRVEPSEKLLKEIEEADSDLTDELFDAAQRVSCITDESQSAVKKN